MVERHYWINRIEEAWKKRSVVWLSGVRRVGKTYLCKSLPEIEYFDCELPRVRRMMEDTEGFLESLRGKRIVCHREPIWQRTGADWDDWNSRRESIAGFRQHPCSIGGGASQKNKKRIGTGNEFSNLFSKQRSWFQLLVPNRPSTGLFDPTSYSARQPKKNAFALRYSSWPLLSAGSLSLRRTISQLKVPFAFVDNGRL